MRPNMKGSYPIFVPGTRTALPIEVKVSEEGIVSLSGEVIGEIPESLFAEPAPAEVEEASVEETPVSEEVVAPVEDASVTEEATAAPDVSWSSVMTKTELLAIAQQLGLPVSSANTKAEILSALDATKQ